MRRTTALLVLGALGVSSAARRSVDAQAGTAAQGSYLSLPQHAPDADARARRMSYKSPYWEFVPYSQTGAGPTASALTMAAPGGILGSAHLNAETATVLGQISVSATEGTRRLADPIAAKCNQIGARGNCFTGLDSYIPLYEAVDPEYQPAAFRFWDSDAAFARERLTSSPAFLTRVANLSAEVPFTQSDVVGYDAITGGVPLAQLAAEDRLFVVDFMPLHRQGLLVPAPNAFVEVPTAVFFLTAAAQTASTSSKLRGSTSSSEEAQVVRLMPLAIKFNVYTQHVYSPKDTHADWLLAKAAFNALERDVNAIFHFTYHSVLANIAIAAHKYLAQEHPLFRPIAMATQHTSGIVENGFIALLTPVAGLFSAYLSLDGPSIKSLLFPHFMRTFDWTQTVLNTDLAKRGVADIPGFLYRDDAGATYDALHAFVQQHLAPFYKTASDVQGDTELAAFLAPLSDATGAYTPANLAYLKGFPSSSEVQTPEDVARMLTQILWLAGVQHHALNSYRILDYDLVYPSHPGKILSAPPREKGTLTDTQLVTRFIAGKGLLDHLEHIPFVPEAQAWMGNLTALGEYIDNLAALPLLGAASALEFFAGTQVLAFDFYPLLAEPERLTNAYFSSDAHDPASQEAAVQLRSALLGLSRRIREREAATAAEAPAYTLLDPVELPFFSYI